MMTDALDCYGLSDIGRLRPVNEDQFLIADLQKSMFIRQTTLSEEDRTRLIGKTQGHLLLVADGLGGAGFGDRASRVAVSAAVQYILNTMPWFFRLDEKHPDDLQEELTSALRTCQEAVESDVARHPEKEGMGTTFTMAYVLPTRLYIVHVGDSRAYLYRDGQLKQITLDHTVAQQLVEQGLLGRSRVPRSGWGDILWNVVGGGIPELIPEVYRVGLQAGDTLLLCTDGLSKQVPDRAVADLLSARRPPEETCRLLIRAANEAGGKDNITVLVARVAPPGRNVTAADAAAIQHPIPHGDSTSVDPVFPRTGSACST